MSDAALSEENMYFTDLPVGEILRRTRLHYGRELPEIEKTLRIRAEQLQALEDGRFEELPAKVYAIGFVRSYSEYLGLDGDKMVHLFKVQSKETVKDEKAPRPVAASESKLPSKWLGLAALLTVLAIGGIYSATIDNKRTNVKAIPPVPEALQKPTIDKAEQAEEQATQESVAQNEDATDNAPVLTEKPKEGIILNIIENSWVEIRDRKAGRKLVSQVLKAGDQYFVPNRPDLVMSIGNAGGVQIEVDGEPLRLLGGQGVVRRNILLDGGYLKSQYAKPSEN